MNIQRIEFGSYLSYSPKLDSVAAQESRTARTALKNDHVLPMDGSMLMSDYVGETIKANIKQVPFSPFFEGNPILVPVPRSSLMQEGTLWVSKRLANALARRGSGNGVEECLKRVTAVHRSSTSSAADRPKAHEHYQSLRVQKIFPEPSEILMIDDIVTRGATAIGAANRLAEAFPKARIRLFSAMRTISPPDVFAQLTAPCTGTIELRGIDCFRRP
jgi:hypothetical protein